MKRIPARYVAFALAGLLLTSGGGALPGLPGPAAAEPLQNPPALWYKIAGEISDADAVAAATRYRIVIMQSWQTAAAQRIKSINPNVTVLAYKDLSCADGAAAALDNERNHRPIATGVGYLEAEQAGWFATDTSGNRVVWKGYPTLWQLEVWDPAYQQRWVDNVVGQIRNSVWDGVFGDDALTTLRYYSSATLAGAPTDAALQAAEGALISKASAALHAVGKKFIVNISGATDNLSIWNQWSTTADGAMLEHFAHWGSDPNSSANYLWDWGSRGWTAGISALGTSPWNVAVTTSADTDDRSYRYGLASFLIATGGHGAFTAVDSYKKAPFRPEQSWDLGFATAARVQNGPIYSRAFPRGFAAVNPSKDQTATISVPAGLVDVNGQPVTSLTLPPLTGAVLHGVPVTTPPPTTAPVKGKWKHHTPPFPVAGAAAPGATSGGAAAALGASAPTTSAVTSAASQAQPASPSRLAQSQLTAHRAAERQAVPANAPAQPGLDSAAPVSQPRPAQPLRHGGGAGRTVPIALVLGVVLVAAAGARRGSSAPDGVWS